MRCPACGWSNTLKNYPKKNIQLKKNIDDDILELLNKHFLTELNDLTAYTLLKACNDTRTEVIKYALQIWERKGLKNRGYDVYYFIGILRNENKKYDEKRKQESSRLDKLPPTQT
jgi:hypothetical protein